MRVWWVVGLGLALETSGAQAQGVKPPRSFEAVALSPTEIHCYWLPAADALSYRIERDGKLLAERKSGDNAYEIADTGLEPGSTHRYVIKSQRDGAESTAITYVERTFATFPLSGEKSRLPEVQYDVVVAQASSGGVTAAIEAARRGLKVALLEPTTRLGGMPVNGLCATDLRRAEHASGFLARFRDRVQALYADEGVTTATGLQYEPRIAHQAMKSLLFAEPNVTVIRRARLANVETRDTSPDGSRRRVESVLVDELNANGEPTGHRARFRAGFFIDATDCGDLAAWAGAPFRLGREQRTPREPHNGVIYYDRANDRRLPGSTGKADKRIQSYAYLFVVKDYGPGVDKTIPKPPGYRREDYIHSPAWKDSWAVTSGAMPNAKYELNQHPQGGDLQAINYGYPTGDYRERARVEKQYRDHVLGYLYYLQTEPFHYCEICKKWLSAADYETHDKTHTFRTEPGQKQLGPPDDDYRDSGGFPPLLYVREGRRILGEQLPEENDITQARRIVRPESIGLGDYPMDSHAVRPKTDWTTPDMGEGEWWLYQYTPWHALPLGVIVPQRLDNVFVTTAVSSTHVSFGTYRLEAVRMAFGQAAGIGASLALRYRLAGREVPARQIQEELLPHVANPDGDPDIVLYYFTDVKPDHPRYRAIQYLASRGFLAAAEAFKPDAPTTRGELAYWLRLLAERAAPPPVVVEKNADGSTLERRAYYPYMGAPADLATAKRLSAQPDANRPVTRAEFAAWMTQVVPPEPTTAPAGSHYADAQGDADRLFALGIDSRLWDAWDAYAPDGKLRFKPDAPLSHADVAAALYIVQIGLGPLFNDHPDDGRNGRSVPQTPFVLAQRRTP